MSARAICRTLSTKGIHVDYRPAAHHALFELDSVFDFKYSALHWCNSIVDEHFKTTLWKQHKNFVLELCEGIQDISQSDIIDDKIRVTFIATGLSDADRNKFITDLVPKLEMGRAAIVVDPFLEKGCSAHDCLIQIADCLNIKRIDRHLLYKSHSQPPPCYVSQDLTKRAPLKAIATFLSDTPAVVATNKCLPDQQHKQKNNTLVVVLRHCEMVNIDVLNNLILLLRDPILPCYVSVLAFTDTLCSLPVQLSPAALAVVSVSTQTTASPWEIYDSLFGRLLNGRDIPVQFPPGLIENIHIAFKDSERCVTSAVHRLKLCLAEHFEHSLALLCMYRETTWLQKMNAMSKSETMLAPPSLLPPPPKKTKSSSSLQRTSSTHSLPDEMSFTNVSQEDVSDAGSIIGSVSGHSITTTIITTAAAANGGGAYSSSSSSSIGRAVVPLEVMSHRHRHGTIALLALIKPVEFVDTGLNAADGTAVMAVLESFEARTSVNIIWFTCLKMMRDSVLSKVQRNNYSADVIWADILSGPSSATSKRQAEITSSLESGRLTTELIHCLKDSLPQAPFSFVQDLLSQLRAYLDNHRADISEDTFSDLGVFLAALHNGVLKLEATFEVVADCFEGTALSVNSSLMKMKQQMRVNPSGVHAQHMQVNLAQRGGSSVAGPDSTGTSSAAGAAAAAGNAQLQSVTLNSVSVYEESLVDLSNWFVSSALHFATLPQPTICRTTKPSGKAATVRHPAGVMQGILEFSEKAEQNALEALNGNLHATFVTAMKDPKRLVQRAIAEAKREAELAERKEVAEARLKGKRLSSKRGRTAGEEETADEADEEEEGGKVGTGPVRFSPDASLLYKLVKTCQQRDVANAWYESFVTAAKIQPWQAVASNKRRKKRDLDESTALKCRFASALYELEKSGIIKCQSAGPHNPTVTIEKKIYTWI